MPKKKRRAPGGARLELGLVQTLLELLLSSALLFGLPVAFVA